MNVEQATACKLKAAGSHPYALEHNASNSGGALSVETVQGEAAKKDEELQLRKGKDLEPSPWWKHAMQQIEASTEEVVGTALLKISEDVCELWDEVKDLRQQVQRASAAASEAKEQGGGRQDGVGRGRWWLQVSGATRHQMRWSIVC